MYKITCSKFFSYYQYLVYKHKSAQLTVACNHWFNKKLKWLKNKHTQYSSTCIPHAIKERHWINNQAVKCISSICQLSLNCVKIYTILLLLFILYSKVVQEQLEPVAYMTFFIQAFHSVKTIPFHHVFIAKFKPNTKSD